MPLDASGRAIGLPGSDPFSKPSVWGIYIIHPVSTGKPDRMAVPDGRQDGRVPLSPLGHPIFVRARKTRIFEESLNFIWIIFPN